MKIKEMVYQIIDDEIKEIKNMQPDKEENEITFKTRQLHYLSEAKAIKARLFMELN